jgi:tetratricopeptide (TPR) repeat protein
LYEIHPEEHRLVKDWFRNSTWSPSDKGEFEGRLQQARPEQRPQYLRIQAVHLAETGREDLLPPAIELLERLLAEYPDSLEVASAQHLRARCHGRMGETLKAVEAYRAAIETERRHQNVRTDAVLDFALFVGEQKLESLFDEVDPLLDAHVAELRPLPVQRFKFHAARALLAENRDRGKARGEAYLALTEAEVTHSGFRYHPAVGMVGHDQEALQARLQAIVDG